MEILDLKTLLFNEFGNTFEFHPEFYKEFVELTSASGAERQLVKQFITRLHAIIALGNIDFGTKWLEHLKEYDNMYSLHLDSKSQNFRLLFSKKSNGKYFLRMFYERSGKKVTSYAPNVKIAIERREYAKQEVYYE